MKIDETWYKLYEKIYGTSFNRMLTIGNKEKGYNNFNITNLSELKEFVEKDFTENEFFISLYNYKTDENILKWNNNKLDNYEQFAEKNCIMFRFRQNTDIIQEEITSLSDIQKFMFIRRSINLGCNKQIVEECNKVYNFFKTHFNMKGLLMFNGFDECLLYYYIDEINLKNPSLTIYNIYELINEKLDLNRLIYKNIEPFAQIVPLAGTQNNQSRLYTQIYYPDLSYEEIMLKGQEKGLNEEILEEIESSNKLEQFLKDIDNEISNNDSNKYEFDEIWNNI